VSGAVKTNLILERIQGLSTENAAKDLRRVFVADYISFPQNVNSFLSNQYGLILFID